jgi:hypothetical protein
MLFISIDEWQSKVDWKFAVSLIEQPHWAVEHTNPWWSNAFFFCLLVSSFLQMWMSQWHTQHIIYLNRRTKINSKLEVVSLDPYLDYRFRIRVENQYGVSDPSPHNSTSRDKLHLEPIARQRFLESGATYNPDTSCYFPRDFDLDRPPHDGYTHAPRFLRQVIRNFNRWMTTTGSMDW